MPSQGLSEEEAARYSRHIVMPEVGMEGQLKLKSARVLVIGAGGLGVPALTYLAAAGVGTIGLVDSDAVEISNLHRQVIYSEADVGRDKVDVARERMRAVNPNVKVVPFKLRLDSSNTMDVIRDFDVIVDATDNFPARYLINDACVLLGKPDVYASVLRFDAQASVFHAKRGPCYRCLYPEPPPPDSVPSCAEAGVLGALPGIMGGIQATQAINMIIGWGDSLVGRLMLFDGSSMSFEELKIKKSPSCPVCGANPTVTELIDYDEFCGVRKDEGSHDDIDPKTLKEWLEGRRKVVLLDVREPFEHQICRLEGSTLIPLGQLERRTGELNASDEVVVYCHTGVRSRAGADVLKRAGFGRVHNLTGGIEAWAVQVDPKMRRY
jgi:sulfur-carrier protein adenylyltransferase/sulfurtransferase